MGAASDVGRSDIGQHVRFAVYAVRTKAFAQVGIDIDAVIEKDARGWRLCTGGSRSLCLAAAA
jgi:hypothetical protein